MTKEELIRIKLKRAKKTFDTAQKVDNEDWNSVANRLYYTVFYLATALLIDMELVYKSHSGAKNAFLLHFIKTKKMDLRFGDLYTNLLYLRQEGDYDDKILEELTVRPYISQVEEFMDIVELYFPDLL